ncbi:MAG: hypothetical protein K8S20_07765 [Chloroflexi bacterium]|nr:hypothetical protein [Chloroflexota bacterium]
MYSYPLKFEFPMISLGRQVDVKNGDGGFIMRVTDPFISFKDSMTAINGKGTAVYQINGDSSFRFLFQFASMSTDWTIQTMDGKPLAFIRNYFARMEEFESIGVKKPSSINPDGTPSLGGIAGQFAANMINQTVSRNVPGRLVYQILDKEGGNVLGWIVPSRGTGWFDFLPYSTRIKILNIPFAARAYAPSYEFKLGNLYGPTALKLQKQRDLFVDRYSLEKTAELSDVDERWAVPALTLVTMFERQRVKEMADW